MRYKTLAAAAVFGTMLLSCGREEVQDIHSLTGDPILFSTDIATRSPLFSSMRGRSFGVMGYGYDGLWSVNEVQATPDVFHKQKVSCSALGVSSYAPVQYWRNATSYTFFGYYPEESSGVVAASAATYEGVPYIDFTLPSSTDPDDYYDVMVAKSVENLTNSSKSNVSLTFRHMLFCMNLEARNLNDEPVRIRRVQFRIDRLDYTRCRFYMDGRADAPQGPSVANRRFSISGTADEVQISPLDNINSEATDISGDRNLMLIPQNTMSGEIFVERYNEENGQWEEKSRAFTSDKEFAPGRRYTAMMNFTGDKLSVTIIESGEWDDSSVGYQFE